VLIVHLKVRTQQGALVEVGTAHTPDQDIRIV
jgi:hypothetical protein